MITTRRDVFDIFYRQFDWEKEPFGCPLKQYTWLSEMVKRKISALKGTCNGWILDDGGGYGIFYNFLKEEERENYVNLDLSTYLLKMSRGHRVREAAEYLPFRDGSFNLVICSEVLEHVNDKIKTIREIQRVLKKKCSLILTTPRTGCREAWLKFRYKLLYHILFIFAIPSILRSKFLKKGRKLVSTYDKRLEDRPTDEEWLHNLLEKSGLKVVFRDRMFVLWQNWIHFPTWLLEFMEKKYQGKQPLPQAYL